MSRRTVTLLTSLILVLILALGINLHDYGFLAPLSSPGTPHTLPGHFSSSNLNSHTLDRATCDAAFPDLYKPIDKAIKSRTNNAVRLSELDIPRGRCICRAMIHENQLYVIDDGDPYKCYILNPRERLLGLLASIHQATVSAPEDIPNIEFSFSYDDLPLRSTKAVQWGLTRRAEHASVWLIPDYGYWAWESVGVLSYNSVRRKIESVNSGTPFRDKKKQAVWRGKTNSSPALRGKLVEASQDQPWSDIKNADHTALNSSDYLSLESLCEYMFLVQTEGTSYSGRLRYLLLCNSVTIAHELEWEEFHTHLMQAQGPNQNYIEVKRDWSDLATKVEYYLAHLDQAEKIAERSYRHFNQKYLTPAAVTCYWRRLFDGWAQVQGFKPELYTITEPGGESVIRGTPYEAFQVTFPALTLSRP